MKLKKSAAIVTGFLHDFAAGYWLATLVVIVFIHRAHTQNQMLAAILNSLERNFFWQSLASVLVIGATGAGRTFTYVDNWYGSDSEEGRRRLLIIKHLLLALVYAGGYWYIWPQVFH